MEQAIVKFISGMKVGFRTGSTYLGNLKGALGRILGGTYHRYAKHREWIARSSITPIYASQELQRKLRVGSAATDLRKATAMKLHHLKYITQHQTPLISSFFIAAFFLGARLGDLQRTENVITTNTKKEIISILWKRHKTVTKIGMKKVLAYIPQKWCTQIKKQWTSKFSTISPNEIHEVLKPLGLSKHSVRRGGLLWRFKHHNKNAEKTMAVSLHTTPTTLLSYLDENGDISSGSD